MRDLRDHVRSETAAEDRGSLHIVGVGEDVNSRLCCVYWRCCQRDGRAAIGTARLAGGRRDRHVVESEAVIIGTGLGLTTLRCARYTDRMGRSRLWDAR